MASTGEGRKRSGWSLLARIGITAAFGFWFYVIWSSTSELNEKLDIATARYSAVHDIEVDYKTEIQEWKNLLLRSSNKETLDANWRLYEAQYRKVAAAAQKIVSHSDVRAINLPMTKFIEAHDANHEAYKQSLDAFVGSGFDPHRADAEVKGIDRPVLEYLAAADTAMQEEKNNINERLTARTRGEIEQSLFVLGFIALLVIWIPKW